MFSQMEVENDDYQIKPMNCPFHVLVLSRVETVAHSSAHGAPVRPRARFTR